MSDELLTALTTPDMLAAFIGALAAIAVGTLGAVVVVWQIGEQARLALAQNRENEATKLKLQVYGEISQICRRASDTQISLSSYVRNFASNVNLIQQWQLKGIPWTVPRERFPALQELDRQFEDAAIEIVFATERWQIIDPRIDLFRYAMNSALHDAREAFHAYVPFAVQAMPMEMPAEATGQPRLFPWRVPDAARLNALTETLISALDTCGTYANDMHVEMQNLLLGGLFGNRVPPREPLDPKFKALRLDRYAELKHYFETQTEWGKTAERVMSEVRERLAREAQQKNEPGA